MTILRIENESVFSSLAVFYAADPRRGRSPEVDFGCWWRAVGRDPTPWRLSWIEATGEIYAVRLQPLHGDIGPVIVFGVLGSRQLVDERLAGWTDHCGDPGSLSWVRAAVQQGGDDLEASRRRYRL